MARPNIGPRFFDAESVRLEATADGTVYGRQQDISVLLRSETAPLTLLATIEGRGIHDTRVVRLTFKAQVVQFPIGEDYPPYVRIFFMGWKGNRLAAASAEAFIYPAKHLLDVRVTTDKHEYAAGERARVNVELRAANGEPLQGEVELGIIDESLYALARDRSRDVRAFFFPPRRSFSFAASLPHRGLNGDFGDSLFDNWTQQLPFGGNFFGGGFGQTDEQPEPTFIRRRFADTAYWSAHLRTDEDGTAELTFPVPDTLSRWRIVARAVAGEDQFGHTDSQMITRQDVMVRLITPRFFTLGDQSTVSTLIRNDSSRPAEFLVHLSGENAKVGGERRILVPSGDERRIDWPIEIARVEKVRLRTLAQSRQGSDAVDRNRAGLATRFCDVHGMSVRIAVHLGLRGLVILTCANPCHHNRGQSDQ